MPQARGSRPTGLDVRRAPSGGAAVRLFCPQGLLLELRTSRIDRRLALLAPVPPWPPEPLGDVHRVPARQRSPGARRELAVAGVVQWVAVALHAALRSSR